MPCKPVPPPSSLTQLFLHNFLIRGPQHAAPAAGNGHNHTKNRSQDAGLSDQMGGQAGYPKQIVFAEACNQDAAVGEGTAEALSPIAAGRLPVIR